MEQILKVHELVSSPVEYPTLCSVRMIGEFYSTPTMFGETTSSDLQVCRKLTRVSLLAYLAEKWGILDMVSKECARRLTTHAA